MNKQQSREMVKQTLTHQFEKAQFLDLTGNILHHIDQKKAAQWNHQYVKDAFKDHIDRFERLGTYTSPEKEALDVLVVHVTKESKLERARTALRNFVADHLRQRDDKDAALVAFVSPEEKQWRFSYVKMEYATTEKEGGKIGVEAKLTPARRFSYIVGEGESCHTAQTRFLALLQNTETDPKLAEIEDAFSVEAVTKEFYEEYRHRFEKIEKALKKLAADDDRIKREFEKKNVNTVDFAKKLMGQIVFLYFLQKKGWLGVAKGAEWGTGPRDFLRKLAIGDYGGYGNFFNDVLEPLFYDTLATDRGHEAWCDHFKCRIPFLNGGLFEPLGNYDWSKTEINLPDKLFTNSEYVEEGVKGTGVLDLFDRYNFTVNEAEPLEKEVAIDPEMLGKVFENLIEENLRKGLGSYYTPREIVHYMCQESLVNYLDSSLNKDKELVRRAEIKTFVHLGEQIAHYESVDAKHGVTMPNSIKTHARQIDEKLAGITVCDPAIGSGAFPVGMMTEIVRARCALTPYFNDFHERMPYFFKRHAIQSCLYGVDIDPGAVEIAKLRLWLSLVVDEEEVKQVRPLPNLDYKIISGDSLVGFPFETRGLAEVEALKGRFFDEPDHNSKAELKKRIDATIRSQLESSERTLGYRVSFDYRLFFSEVFRTRGGFDIVIGNPPYVRVQNIAHQMIDIYKRIWSTAWKRIDISTFFMELSTRIGNKDGVAVFISSNQFLATEYGRKTREFFLKTAGFTRMLDFADLPVFENTLTYVSVFFLRPAPTTEFCYSKVPALPFEPSTLKWEKIANTSLGSDGWTLGANNEMRVISRLTAENPPLSEYASCWAGLFTGRDDLLLFEEGDERLNSIERKILLPVLRAQSCERYCLARPTRLTIYPYKEINGKTVLIPEKELRESFPKAYAYLKQHKDVLSGRRDSRTTLGEKSAWYGLVRFGRRSVFEREKIVSPGEVRHNKFALDKTGSGFSCARVFAITSESSRLPLLYLLGLLNSKLIEFFLHLRAPLKQGGYYSYSANVLASIPIAQRGEDQDIIDAVERILAAKRKDCGVDSTDWEREIDQRVYGLYRLTKEEIAIVEGSKGK